MGINLRFLEFFFSNHIFLLYHCSTSYFTHTPTLVLKEGHLKFSKFCANRQSLLTIKVFYFFQRKFILYCAIKRLKITLN